jgi:Flp pilus assembly protein CpaB
MQRRNNTLLIVLGLVLVIAAVVLIVFLVLRGGQPAQPDLAAQTSTALAQGGGGTALTPGTGPGQPVAPGTVVVVTPTIAFATPTLPPDQISVVVAQRAIPQGSILTAEDLKTIPRPRAEVDAVNDVTDIAQAVNRINLVPYNPEQPLRKRELVDGGFSSYMKQLVQDKRLEPGKKAFAYVTNEISAAAGLISENDLVDVVATYVFERRDTSAAPSGVSTVQNSVILELTTKTILQNVRVLKVIRLEKGLQQITVPRPTDTPIPPGEGTPLATGAIAPPPGTPTPVPTLPPFSESGVGFPNNIVLVLAVTDQEAEVLKFTREARYARSASIQSNIQRLIVNPTVAAGGGDAFQQTNQQGEAGSTDPNAATGILQVPVIHFTLRGRPVDTTNPQDPAVVLDRTSGVTYRTLVRDYGVPIPVIVFATQNQ